MARRYEYDFRVVKTIFHDRAQRVDKILFSTQENNIHIFKLSCSVLQKSEKANREHINLAGKHARFSRVVYFFSYLH